MSWRAALRWELALARRAPATWLVVAVLVATCALAVWSGTAYRGRWADEIERHRERGRAQLAAQIADLEGGEARAGLPLFTRLTMVLPPAPLADLATGRSDLEPRTATSRPTGAASGLFRDYQTASPLALAAARFDLGFVLVYLVPILIIALGYNLLSSDRERGMDRLWAVQGVSARRLAASRALVRGALLAAPAVLALAVLGLFDPEPRRWLALAAVAIAVLGYLAVWWAIVLVVASLRLPEMPSLLVLLTTWLVLALLLPAGFAVVARTANPPPSRFAMIATARAAEIAANQRASELIGGYLHDHPDLAAPAAGGEHPFDWAKRAFVVVREVDRATVPLLDQLDATLADQHETARWWGLLSPPALLQRTLAELAGTDETRALAFRRQARGYLHARRDELGRRTMAHRAVSADELRGRAEFRFTEAAPTRELARAAPALGGLWLIALGLLAWARHRLRRWP